jgi:hypothetical protein
MCEIRSLFCHPRLKGWTFCGRPQVAGLATGVRIPFGDSRGFPHEGAVQEGSGQARQGGSPFNPLPPIPGSDPHAGGDHSMRADVRCQAWILIRSNAIIGSRCVSRFTSRTYGYASARAPVSFFKWGFPYEEDQ